MAKRGPWVKLQNDSEALTAIKAAGVHGDGMIQANVAWVQRWVVDAIETYRKNNYAGMSLVEFLLKVKPQ